MNYQAKYPGMKPMRFEPFTHKSDELIIPGMGYLPPQALDLEEAVLGAVMIERPAMHIVLSILPSADVFYRDSHKVIYQAILSLFVRQQPIDILTVTQKLREMGKLELAGGPVYITELSSRVNSAANIEFHCRKILECYVKRTIIAACQEAMRQGFDDTYDAFELLDTVQKVTGGLTNVLSTKKATTLAELVPVALQAIQSNMGKGGITGVPSGFITLDEITGGWQDSDLIILAARPGMGKCLGKGTKVVMYDGTLKNVEDVQVGDQLMGDDSTPRNVLSLARGRERMYWVRQNKGIDYRVNESHIISLKRSRTENCHKHGDVLNISIKDYIQKSKKFKTNYKGYKVAVDFEEKPLPIEPYYLGVWLGDGTSANSSISNPDKEIISYLGEFSERNGYELTLTKHKKSNKCPRCNFPRKLAKSPLHHRLRDINVLNNKHIPHDYLVNSKHNRLQLLAGILDTDGYMNKGSNGYEITQKNKTLAYQIKFLCDSLGYRTSITKKIATISSIGFSCEVYRVNIYGNTDEIPVKIPRKKSGPWKSPVDWTMTGIQVEYDKVDDYYGFELDGNKLFLLEDMTVTHNTTMALNCAKNAAVDFGVPTLIFSLEMSSQQLTNKMIATEAEKTSSELKKGKVTEYELPFVVEKAQCLLTENLIIDDTASLPLVEMRAKCHKHKAENNIKLIVVDYLQLMTVESINKPREQQVSEIAKGLKAIAKELNIPIIALSQLSRAVETRGGDKRPQLSDLRESGSIEQEADMVLFLYRPEYYKIDSYEDGTTTKDTVEVIIAKHRNGNTIDIKMGCQMRYSKFFDLKGEAKSVPAGNQMPDARPFPVANNNFEDGDEYPF